MKIGRPKSIHVVALLSIIFVIGLYYLQTNLLEGFEDNTYDLRMKALRASPKSRPNIAIIAIDDKTIAELGRFPFSRVHYATLLDVTTRAGARAVLFDAFFPEAQTKPVDEAFAAAIKRSGRVTLACGFEFDESGNVAGLTSNIPVLQNAAGRIAHINVFPESDGVIRFTKLGIVYQGKIYPSLGLAGAAELTGIKTFELDGRRMLLGPRRIPIDGEQRMLINYAGPPGLYERFSFADVVKGRVPADKLKDRVLFVGATALGIYDMRITPFSNNTPGVEVNAGIADNIATGNFIRRAGPEKLIDLALIIILGIATTLMIWNLRHSVSLPLTVLLIACQAAFAGFMFLCGRWISIVYPVLCILLTSAVTGYLRFFIVDRQAREIRSMFSSYVSKRVVDLLVKNPEMAKIGGESRELTILFADVQNYTTYSEKRSPADVVRILNDYLAAMTDIVMKYDGTLDKFLGDGILAYWNAPLIQDNHTELAVRCALEMMAGIGPLQKKWLSEGSEPITWGIGLNTGEVIVGNIGAVGKKMEYTAIGDGVNLTYRIQNESRDAGCAVITRALYERVKDIVITEPLGSFRVKGKQIPVEIFALKGLRPETPAADVDGLERYRG